MKEQLANYLYNLGFVSEEMLKISRLFILSKYKSIKYIELSCDTNQYKMKVGVKFKWWGFGKSEIMEQISDFYVKLLPAGISSESEAIIEKKYNVIVEEIK